MVGDLEDLVLESHLMAEVGGWVKLGYYLLGGMMKDPAVVST